MIFVCPFSLRIFCDSMKIKRKKEKPGEVFALVRKEFPFSHIYIFKNLERKVEKEKEISGFSG